MSNTKTYLEEDKMFHIYNHAVGKDNFFNTADNYHFFLLKLKEYLQYYIDVYAYCLMPNHFHFVIKVKEREVVVNEYLKKAVANKSKIKELDFVPKLVSRQFGHFFNSYAQAYNKENYRRGSLFKNRFNREPIEDENYLKKVIIYTHKNPVEAGFVNEPADWKYSSYRSIVSKKPTLIKRSEVIELFENLENFIFCHK